MGVENTGIGQVFSIPKVARLQLPCDLQIGTTYTSREKDKYAKRRLDRVYVGSDFGPFERTDYPERFAAGQTNFHVVEAHQDLVVRNNVFYHGPGGKAIKYPESLYRSNYLGPDYGWLDEPAAVTSIYYLRPDLGRDADLKKEITLQYVLERFKGVFEAGVYGGRPTLLIISQLISASYSYTVYIQVSQHWISIKVFGSNLCPLREISRMLEIYC